MLAKRALNACLHLSRNKRSFARLPSVTDLKDPMKVLKHGLFDGRVENIIPCPRECDVLIIGGSVVGSNVAYFLKESQNKLNVMVIEPDLAYTKASALLSAGGMRQQFTCRENIEMSQFGFEFLRRSQHLLSVKGEAPPDVHFNHGGYLILGGEADADSMLQAHQLQQECGAINMLLSPQMLKERYPWMNTDGVEIASVGLQGEGWFDPAALLSGLKGKNASMGVHYIKGKVIGFEHETLSNPGQPVTDEDRRIIGMVLVELPNGDVQPVKAPIIVNAAGAWAGEVAELAGIGVDTVSKDPVCAVPLPVEPRKRYIFSIHCPNGPGLDCGLITDCTQGSVYVRREGLGNNYICGMSPPPELEPNDSDLDNVDFEFFENEIWPRLAHRMPAFEGLKLKSGWSGYYDYNFVDQNLIIGNHPYFNNFIFSNGSTGHGLQHSPAMGRAICELINYDEFRTVNLEAFSFERFLDLDDDAGTREKNIF